VEPTIGADSGGLPDPGAIRRQVARRRRLVVPLDDTMDMPAVMAIAQALQATLSPDMRVIAAPPMAGRGPILTVLQLITDAEAATLRPALQRLLTEFRQLAGALVDQLPTGAPPAREDDRGCPESVRVQDTTWYLTPHGEHCRFEDPASGVIVEADMHAPDTVDPYFLLLYAETSGRHDVILDACAEGFHDMCRLLDLA
jgi:hypothetical protein